MHFGGLQQGKSSMTSFTDERLLSGASIVVWNPASVVPEPESMTRGFIGSTWPEVVVDKLTLLFPRTTVLYDFSRRRTGDMGNPCVTNQCVFDVCYVDRVIRKHLNAGGWRLLSPPSARRCARLEPRRQSSQRHHHNLPPRESLGESI